MCALWFFISFFFLSLCLPPLSLSAHLYLFLLFIILFFAPVLSLSLHHFTSSLFLPLLAFSLLIFSFFSSFFSLLIFLFLPFFYIFLSSVISSFFLISISSISHQKLSIRILRKAGINFLLFVTGSPMFLPRYTLRKRV